MPTRKLDKYWYVGAIPGRICGALAGVALVAVLFWMWVVMW
jgi:hypothetical protein